MSEGGFLARWARRKAEARREEESVPATVGAADPFSPAPSPRGGEGSDFGDGSNRVPSPPRGEGQGEGGSRAPTPAEPIDPATLPDLATLGSDSDFTPFLRPGVPTSLRTAALRRLWTSDPAILNYRTLADYDWDFNAPGYGSLLPMDDVKRLVDLAIGELRRSDPTPADEAAPAPPATVVGSAPPADRPPAALPPPTVADGVPLVPVAPQAVVASADRPPPPRRRRHGGAAPD
jgi:hypothetical protein